MSSQPTRTGFLYHSDFLLHRVDQPGLLHPERPERLQSILNRVEVSGLLARMQRLDFEEAEEKWLEKVHTRHHIDRVTTSSGRSFHFFLDADTYSNGESFRVAKLAAGAVMRAVDGVMTGEVDNAFCAVRPPGHHAETDRVMGFCLFNNVAVGARYAQEKYQAERILIIDWDVHHGNGTQEIFEDDPTVFYFSTHQSPFYPGTGEETETGIGRGIGCTLNMSVPAHTDESAFLRRFHELLNPAADSFKPNLILLSAGFDAHCDDPLAQLQLGESAFAELTRAVLDIAERHCDGRVVSVLEGGYNLEALASSVHVHLETLLDSSRASAPGKS